jgi:hypothetical protein
MLPEFPPDLAFRLAEKSGLSLEDARRFLDVFAEAAEENAWPYGLPVQSGQAQAIVFPLVEQKHGKPPTGPTQPAPPKPRDPRQRPPGAYPGPSVLVGKDEWAKDAEQAAAGGYPGPSILLAPGAYPGPSITVSIHDPHGTGLHLGNMDLGNLGEAVHKAIESSSAGEAVSDVSEGFEKAGEY